MKSLLNYCIALVGLVFAAQVIAASAVDKSTVVEKQKPSATIQIAKGQYYVPPDKIYRKDDC